MRIVFDLETDGLLGDGSQIWCGTVVDVDSPDTITHFPPGTQRDLFHVLLNADLLIGHNIAGFDIPFMEVNYEIPLFDRSKIRDTYVMSKLFYPKRSSHSLDSWGKVLGIEKPEHEDWSQYSEEMKHRNIEDVKINLDLYNRFVERECKKWPQWKSSIILEGEMHYWQAYQELAGVGLDVGKAEALVKHLDEEIAKLDEQLHEALPPQCKQVGVTVTKPFKKDGDYTKMVEDWFECINES